MNLSSKEVKGSALVEELQLLKFLGQLCKKIKIWMSWICYRWEGGCWEAWGPGVGLLNVWG